MRTFLAEKRYSIFPAAKSNIYFFYILFLIQTSVHKLISRKNVLLPISTTVVFSRRHTLNVKTKMTTLLWLLKIYEALLIKFYSIYFCFICSAFYSNLLLLDLYLLIERKRELFWFISSRRRSSEEAEIFVFLCTHTAWPLYSWRFHDSFVVQRTI